jgi:AcrR family transcriptional regulator
MGIRRARNGNTPPRRDAEVLAVAARLFAERGYLGTTMQDIADELGILKGSLYHYISTKEHLLFRLIEGVHHDVGQVLADVASAPGLLPLDRLALYVERQVQQNLSAPQRIAVYYDEMDKLQAERHRFLLCERRRHQAFVVDLISAAQQDGAASRERSARVMAHCVFATIIWTARWHRSDATARDRIAKVCSAYVIAGLSARPRSLGDTDEASPAG